MDFCNVWSFFIPPVDIRDEKRKLEVKTISACMQHRATTGRRRSVTACQRHRHLPRTGPPRRTHLDHVGEPALGDGRDGRQLDAALQEADVVLLLERGLPAGRQRVTLQPLVHARLVQHRAQLPARTHPHRTITGTAAAQTGQSTGRCAWSVKGNCSPSQHVILSEIAVL